MKFRPCIDIHNGRVKQIVGGSLTDKGDSAKENFSSDNDGAFYADFYKADGLTGGHVIMLNSRQSEFYEATKSQAVLALNAYKGGLQIGGGIDDTNAEFYLNEGASHVIVTSFVFKDGEVNTNNLNKIKSTVGKERLVIDLSCRKMGGQYYIVTDRWQKFTNTVLDKNTLDFFSDYCDEFLVHAVDVEGKANGIEEELATLLGEWGEIPITYAGGVGSFRDIKKLKALGAGKLDVTIGSALDLFGGSIEYKEVLKYFDKENK